jgi:hypothetical protein
MYHLLHFRMVLTGPIGLEPYRLESQFKAKLVGAAAI